MRGLAAIALLGLVACQPPLFATDDDASTDGATSSSTGIDTTTSASTTPTTGPTNTTTGIDPSTSSSSGSSPGPDVPGGFLVDPDTGFLECSVYDQNCPPGEKCMPYANDGGTAWNDTRCSPIDPDPDDVGEPCMALGDGVAGVDTCALGAMCWYLEVDTLAGTCVPFCVGSESHPDCEYPDHFCSINGDGVLALCLPFCDPLGQDCPDGYGCYAQGSSAFTCAPDASGDTGQYGDACEFINVCDPGLFCALAESIPACESIGCCTPFCNIGDPSCPDPELECAPVYGPGEAPNGYEHVGVCLLP